MIPVRRIIVRRDMLAWSPLCDFFPPITAISWPSRHRGRGIRKRRRHRSVSCESLRCLIAVDASDQAKRVVVNERGEALLADIPRWFALWTHSHCEQLVHDQLASKGFRVFLPTVQHWTWRRGVKRLLTQPMFSSYLFVHHAMDKRSYLEIVSTRGLVRILGERWDKLAAIPTPEIDAIQQLATSRVASMPYPYLRAGERVRITDGPLAGLEGAYVRSRRNQGLLVLSVELLNRSVAVEIDGATIAPVSPMSAGARSSSAVPA
jgi:transcription termination/antitermination protein NusG